MPAQITSALGRLQKFIGQFSIAQRTLGLIGIAGAGALMLLPTGLYAHLDGMDEGYRLHAEDLDLCRRVREAGYEVVVANDLRVTHLRGVSSRRRPVWVEWQKHRGLWRYFSKFEANDTPAWLTPVLWCGLWAHFALAALRARWRPRQ